MFNHLCTVWPTGYQRGSLGKSHQNGEYSKQTMWKSSLSTDFEQAAFAFLVHCSTPLELERTSPCMLNFSYLNPATCFYYDAHTET